MIKVCVKCKKLLEINELWIKAHQQLNPDANTVKVACKYCNVINEIVLKTKWGM